MDETLPKKEFIAGVGVTYLNFKKGYNNVYD